MSLIVGTNSYVDVATADAYFADRLFAESWASTDVTTKEQALISSTLVMDNLCTWVYTPTDEDQLLAFPRNKDELVPINIKTAQMEIAFEMISQGIMTSVESTKKLSQLKADDVLFSFFESMSTPLTIVNDLTKKLLRQFGMCSFGDSTIQTPKLVR